MTSKKHLQLPHPDGAILFVILVFAYCFDIGRNDLWYDEVFSAIAVSGGLRSIYWTMLGDVHPPLYYLILWPFSLVGTSEAILRLPSALCVASAAIVTYLMARDLFNRQAAVIAALLMGTSPFQTFYAQEARMYGLLELTIAIAIYGVATLVRVPGRLVANIDPMSRAGVRVHAAWGAFIIGSTSALYTHNAGIVFLISADLVLFSFAAVGLERPLLLRGFATLAIANLCILLLYVPVAVLTIPQAIQAHQQYWITNVDFSGALRNLDAILLNGSTQHFGTFYDIVLCGLAGISLIVMVYGGHQRTALFISLCLITPIAVIQVISQWTPIFIARVLIWLAIPFSLLLGGGISLMPGRATKALITATVLTLNVTEVWSMHINFQKPGFRALAATLVHELRAGDVVLAYPHSAWVTTSYYGTVQGVSADVVMRYSPDAAKQYGADPGIGRIFLVNAIQESAHIADAPSPASFADFHPQWQQDFSYGTRLMGQVTLTLLERKEPSPRRSEEGVRRYAN